MERTEIGIKNLPGIFSESLITNGMNFNIIIIGSHGIGKTTFLNQFFKNSIFKSNIHTECLNEVINCKINITETKLKIKESNFSINIEIIEVDGVGDSIDNSGTEEYINNIFYNRFDNYQINCEEKHKNFIQDCRIHLCLYFLEPNEYIRNIDILLMNRISESCNIIPIIGKSDFLDLKTRDLIKVKILKIYESTKIIIYDNEIPYFIVSGEMGNDDQLINERKEEWESIELNKASVGFSKLYNFLFSDGILKLIDGTENLYDKYKVMKLATKLIDESPKIFNKELISKVENEKKLIENLRKEISEKVRDIKELDI